MIKKQIFVTAVMSMTFLSLFTLAYAREPSKPYVYGRFSEAKEKRIDALKTVPVKGAIEQLRKVDFFVDEEYLNKGIYVAFSGRKEEVISAALDLLKLPRLEIVNNKKIDRGDVIFVAKKILQVFPEESLIKISKIYKVSNAAMKSNLIEVLGNMAGSEPRDMLIAALDDKTFCEEENPEMEGQPMRVCDAAYNQLVLRYMVPDVLRTIGPAYTLEQRDYHISVLKEKI